jgi:hypothetical protein
MVTKGLKAKEYSEEIRPCTTGKAYSYTYTGSSEMRLVKQVTGE